MRKGNIIPVIIIILAIAAVVGMYAFSVWPTDKDFAATNTQVTAKHSANANTTVANSNTTSNTNTVVDPTADWKIYTNPTVGYSIQYPTDWQIGSTKEPVLLESKAVYPADSIAPGSPSYLLYIEKVSNDNEKTQLTSTKSITVNGVIGTQGTKTGIPNQTVSFLTKNNVTLRISWPIAGTIYNQILSTLTFPSSIADWKTYTNSSLGFTLKYPSSWVVSAGIAPTIVCIAPGAVECPSAGLEAISIIQSNATSTAKAAAAEQGKLLKTPSESDFTAGGILGARVSGTELETASGQASTKIDDDVFIQHGGLWDFSNTLSTQNQTYLDILSTFTFTK